MFSWVGALISGLGSALSGLFGYLKTKVDARQIIEITRIIQGYNLAGKEIDADTILAIEKLRRRNKLDQFISILSFAPLYLPFVCGLIWPDATISYFVNVVGVFPDWFIFLFVTINVAQWGVRRLVRL